MQYVMLIKLLSDTVLIYFITRRATGLETVHKKYIPMSLGSIWCSLWFCSAFLPLAVWQGEEVYQRLLQNLTKLSQSD